MKSIFFFVLLFYSFLDAKEIFTSDKIVRYLGSENPFVYTAHAKEYVSKEKEQYSLGAFDTKLSAKYDKKEYPATTGEFLDVSLKKPMENGMELIASYRKAKGTQEYNNIKTGQDGEALVGVKIPFFAILNNTNTRKLNLEVAQLDSVKYRFNSKDNLRMLYTQVLRSYYTLLYYKVLLHFEEELFHTAKKREHFIRKRVEVGSLAEVSLLEVQQQIINRQQRVLKAKNNYLRSLETFLQYLNISEEEFFQEYELKNVLQMQTISVDLESALDEAIHNRADLKMLKYEKEQLELKKQNAKLLGYPNLNVSLYGVHDFKYNEGFKIAVDMDFPIERRKYLGKTGELTTSIKNINKLQEKRFLNIKTNLANIIHSLHTIDKSIAYSSKEVKLVTRLEDVENKKYKAGSSNLFMLNQRETYTLEIKKKILKYKLEYLLLREQFYNEVGRKRSF
ncbi:TolC family protein [Sulfurimonas sp.]|uniref:TolC family protein n=1 Tax=Sulfurimonas sp. TaxID=2022749 RepID=UPI0026070BE0|nr:TolC family protein [Sulfurimonas sp.]